MDNSLLLHTMDTVGNYCWIRQPAAVNGLPVIFQQLISLTISVMSGELETIFMECRATTSEALRSGRPKSEI
jgi:hypothetical protein